MNGRYPQFKGNAVAKFASAELRKAALSRIAGFKKDAEADNEKPERAWEVTWNGKVSAANDGFISVLASCDWYTGGAHPNRDYQGLNFAMKGGKAKRIGLADIMLVRMTPDALASQIVLPKLKAMGASGVVDAEVTSLTRQQADNFVITKSGLTWLFSPYEVASYAEGEFFVKVSWAELKGKVSMDF